MKGLTEQVEIAVVNKAEDSEKVKERIRKAKEKERRIKIAKVSISSAVCLTAILIFIFKFLLPFTQYNQAEKLLDNGKYSEALELYKKSGSFSESEKRVVLLTGIQCREKRIYPRS